MHKQLNKEWLKQNTERFDVTKLEKYNVEGHKWLITPDPIEVKY